MLYKNSTKRPLDIYQVFCADWTLHTVTCIRHANGLSVLTLVYERLSIATVILPKEIQKLYSVVTTAMPVNCFK